MRVRRNAALMTHQEWARYCRAIVTLKHTFAPGSSVSVYDQFVALHLGVTELVDSSDPNTSRPDGAHRDAAFLAWHREYLRRYELALATVDPRVTLPYWNWGFGAPSETEDLFSAARMGRRNGAILTGHFSRRGSRYTGKLGFAIHQLLSPRVRGTTLRRGDDWSPDSLPEERSVFDALKETEYNSFWRALNVPHGSVHVIVGGHMGDFSSPNDPLFFMHHAQVDRIWALWQRRHPGAENYAADGSAQFGHNLSDNMWPWDGGASRPRREAIAELVPKPPSIDLVTPADVLDTRELGYIYDGEDVPREFDATEKVVTHRWHGVDLGPVYTRPTTVVASIQTFAGADTASVRVKRVLGFNKNRIDFRVEEEKSRDAETRHLPESIAYLVGEEGLIHDVSGRVVGEMGTVKMGQAERIQWELVPFAHQHEAPIAVATVSSCFDPDPAHIRMRVSVLTLYLRIEEWAYQDGVHDTEEVSYLIVEAGRHRLLDGSVVEAGTVKADHDWSSVEFSAEFTERPVVLSHCQTVREGLSPVVTRQRHVAVGGFDVCLQEEERARHEDGGRHPEETIGYIAFGEERPPR